MNRPSPHLALLLAIAFLGACASTPDSPLQRQAVETTYVEGDYNTIYRATRTAFQNEGYMVEQSEIASGFLQFSTEVRDKDPALAGVLGILPGGGSFYVGNYGLGVLDLLLWPFSVAWDGPLSAITASRSRRTVKATVTMVEVGKETEIRTTFQGSEVSGEYAIALKRLYAEIQRQVLMRDSRDETMAAAAPPDLDEETPEEEQTSQAEPPEPPPVAAAPAAGPDGLLAIQTMTVSAGVGVTWGDGALEFGGTRHLFSLQGLTLVDLGVARVVATGEVFRLDELSKFDGTYVAAETGIAGGKGISAFNMINDKGVVIRMTSEQKGLRFTASRGGMTIRLKGSDNAPVAATSSR